MNRMQLSAAVCLSAIAAIAEPSGDRPDFTHAWAVHDVNRPDPVKISAEEGRIPSDAIVLFDGTEESVRKNWIGADGEPTKWTVRDGEFVCVPGAGYALTREWFEDCQLHVEWKSPIDDPGGFGNSGVLFCDAMYEIQILDSYAIVPSKSPFKPANYADGQAGAVYGQSPCLVNPARKPGEWQSFDIVFHPPCYEGERLVDPGSVTVFFNGVLVQDNWAFEGTTGWCTRPAGHAPAGPKPLGLQDHGNPVPFRNIWIRRIPSRYAETTCGGPGVKYADVAALRSKLAAQSLAAANATDDPAERFIRLWESFAYEPSDEVRELIGPASLALKAAEQSGDERVNERERHAALERFMKMLIRQGYIEESENFLEMRY